MRAIRFLSTSRFRPPAEHFAAAAILAATLVFGQQARGADTTVLAARDRDADVLLAQMQAGIQTSDILPLEAVVNEQVSGNVFVYDGPGGLAIEEAALKRWHVIVPAGTPRDIEGRRYVPLTVLPGATAKIEPRTQRLLLTLPAALFEPSAVAFDAVTGLTLSPPPWSAFANYDLFGFTSRSSTYGAALFELGTAGPYGSGVAGVVINSSQVSGGNTGRTVLLDASWRYDDPAGPRTLLLGNAISRSGVWGNSLRIAGVQYGTNFSLQPNLITYPVQAFAGTAVVPSTVDVFVNGSRVGSQQVQPGPFSLNNVPIVTGSGDVQLVVRDAFGQQQIITQPFYASQQLLKPGLDDYTISAGSERVNYGIDSFDYGSGFVSAYWRRGLTDEVTVELLGEGDNKARAAGGSINFVPGSYGVMTLGAAGSGGDAGGGYLGIAGYQYQGPRFNFAIQSVWASPNFRLPGNDLTPPLQRMSLASIGYNFGAAGTVGFAWVDQHYRGQPGTSTSALSYSVSLSPRTSFNLSVSRSQGTSSQTTAFATLIFALDDKTSASADFTVTRSEGSTHTVAGIGVQRSLPIGEGYGYQLRATSDRQYQAGAIYAGPFGRYSVDVASANGDTAARASISGGIGMLGGVVFASRPIVDSFGLVRVDGVRDVSVFQNGNFAGRTDRDGVAVLTQMYPYALNRITIDDKAVPIDITLNAREYRVAPYYRSGVIVDFGARKLLNAIVEVRLPNGQPLPSGAEVYRQDANTRYPVGSDGEIFISDLVYGSSYTADWANGRCRFVVPAPPSPTESMPRLGPFICAAVKEGS